MNSDFNHINLAAPAALAMVAAVFGLAAAVLAIVVGWIARKRVFAIWVGAAAGSSMVLYMAVLLGLSFVSQERALPPGAEKYFCEIDCHLAYSITNVERVKTLGSGPQQVTALGEFYVVSLRTRFDETTISPRRPRNATLTPNPRELELVAADGREFPVSPAANAVLDAAGNNTWLGQPLVPGQQYVTRVAFDVPRDAVSPRLLLTSRGWDYRWMIGQENSWGHKKTWLALGPASAVAGR